MRGPPAISAEPFDCVVSNPREWENIGAAFFGVTRRNYHHPVTYPARNILGRTKHVRLPAFALVVSAAYVTQSNPDFWREKGCLSHVEKRWVYVVNNLVEGKNPSCLEVALSAEVQKIRDAYSHRVISSNLSHKLASPFAFTFQGVSEFLEEAGMIMTSSHYYAQRFVRTIGRMYGNLYRLRKPASLYLPGAPSSA